MSKAVDVFEQPMRSKIIPRKLPVKMWSIRGFAINTNWTVPWGR